MRIPTVQPINIPGLIGYYAGDDGEIYRLRATKKYKFKIRNITSRSGKPKSVIAKIETGEYNVDMFKLKAYYGNERMKVKYVNVKKLEGTNLKNKAYPVHHLVATAFKSYTGHGSINFTDGNKGNTRPGNLEINNPKLYQGSASSFNNYNKPNNA